MTVEPGGAGHPIISTPAALSRTPVVSAFACLIIFPLRSSDGMGAVVGNLRSGGRSQSPNGGDQYFSGSFAQTRPDPELPASSLMRPRISSSIFFRCRLQKVGPYGFFFQSYEGTFAIPRTFSAQCLLISSFFFFRFSLFQMLSYISCIGLFYARSLCFSRLSSLCKILSSSCARLTQGSFPPVFRRCHKICWAFLTDLLHSVTRALSQASRRSCFCL